LISSEPAVRARGLRKTYRLYGRPRDRLLDMLGLLARGSRRYREVAALDEVSLDIVRGEKVAIIGRNGAGKSTFLKLVSQVIAPTAGSIDVAGTVHALLQLGTGFHGEFTGRQNAQAYLAQLGVTGVEADRRVEEIVQFAELADYVDQPVKTYSTGMAARLMFATSTAITPDLLLLDEVMGVGDAYFTQKSFDRISALCAAEGTTLLLVTHDLYAATRVCERVIWLDRGRILMDGGPSDVIRAYEASIRHQEEQRLRAEKQQRLQSLLAADLVPIVIEIRHTGATFQPCPVYFSRMALDTKDARVITVALADDFPTDVSGGAHLDLEGSAWGEAVQWGDRPARPFLHFGSPFHRVSASGAVPRRLVSSEVSQLSLSLEYLSAEPCRIEASAYAADLEAHSGPLVPSAGSWVATRVPLTFARAGGGLCRRETSSVHGTGAIAVRDVTPRNAAGTETFVFQHGEPFALELRCRVEQPGLAEPAQVLVAFARDGVYDVCRVTARDVPFRSDEPESTVTMRLPKLTLASGRYALSIMVARQGYYDRPQARFFSINPEVHACLSRVVEIEVQGGGGVATGTVFVADGEWRIAHAARVPARVETWREKSQ